MEEKAESFHSAILCTAMEKSGRMKSENHLPDHQALLIIDSEPWTILVLKLGSSVHIAAGTWNSTDFNTSSPISLHPASSVQTNNNNYWVFRSEKKGHINEKTKTIPE